MFALNVTLEVVFFTRITTIIVALVSIITLYRTIILRRKLGISIPWPMTIFTLFWLSTLVISVLAAIFVSSDPISTSFYITTIGSGYVWSIAGLTWHVLYFVKHAGDKMLVPITKLAENLVSLEKEARGKT